jgi:cytosine/adenosine deaminase-related metal-dependent hydrolase
MSAKTLLRGGCVLTLGARTPNFPQADVLIDGGRIAEIGPGLRARDAEQVDAADTIVMPGFVDTHRHAWRSLYRNLGAAARGDDGSAAFGERAGPDDVYAVTLIALLGAVEAGVTTVVDWSDAGAGDGFAEAALQAHADAGLRTVFVHVAGAPGGRPVREAVERARAAAGPATTVAVGTEGLDPAALEREWAAARELGLPVQGHAGADGPGAIGRLHGRGLLGRDATVVHAANAGEPDLDAIASSGAALALAPSAQMAGGTGMPGIQEVIGRGIRPGLGVDDERVAPGDMFAQMRATISLQHATVFERKLAGKGALPKLMSTRDVIRYATVDGARVAGLVGVTGSLEPGMRADVIVLRTDKPNIFPINDAIGAVVWGMDTSNVDWVFVEGQALMSGGVFRADVHRVRELAEAMRQRMTASSDLLAGAAQRGEE